MCGIYGMVTDKTNYKAKYDLFKALALHTQVRGRHATGFAYSDGQHEVYFKHGEEASKFVLRPEFEAILNDRPNIIIGHDRYATHGDPADNATNHPFKSRTLQFIHNGVISNYESLKAEYKCYSECDSEVILRVLEKAPRRITGIQRVYEEVRGSFACALMDTRKLRLWLFRNHGNPIYLVHNAGLNCLAFASTREIFDRACKDSEVTEGWSKGQYWTDDYILSVKYVPDTDGDRDTGKVLRETVEVEHKQIDPSVVSAWTDSELARYRDNYEARVRGKTHRAEREQRHKACQDYKDRQDYKAKWNYKDHTYTKGSGSGERRATWDSENKCWTI